MPAFTVIAGPNGAGKTTLGDKLAAAGADLGHRIDPDRIAADRGLSAGEAARTAVREMRAHLTAGESFIQETTLASRQPIRLLSQARALGFETRLVFVGVTDMAISQDRVTNRVAKGGHDIPTEDQLRRFERTFRNAVEAARIADSTVLIDNSQTGHRAIARIARGRVTELRDNVPQWVREIVRSLDRARDHGREEDESE